MPIEPTRRRERMPAILLGAYLLALVYGSLYPWSGWRAGAAASLAFLLEPWPRWWTWFDVLVNVLVYVPLGALLAEATGRRLRALPGAVAAVLVASAVSIALEALQGLVPARVPSRTDWLANTFGAIVGVIAATRRTDRELRRARPWHRASLPAPDATAGLALLAAWVAIQMHPQRLLFGTGDVLEPLLGMGRALLAQIEDGGAGSLAAPLASAVSAVRAPAELGVQIEAFGTASAVLALGLVVREIWSAGGPRLPVTAGLLIAAMGVRSASGAVLLGPGQAFAWLSAGAQGGLVTGAVALAVLSSGRRRARLAIAIAALLATSLLASVFPPDAYHDSMLKVWNQGAWRNFNGLLQALAALWPFAAIAWCAARLRALGRGDADL